MPRQTVTQVSFTSHISGKVATFPADQVPEPVTLTITGKVNGEPYKKVLTALDFTPDEWEAFRAFAENPDETPLVSRLRGTPAASNGGKHANPDTQKVREWARANGIEIGEKGRIPAEVQAKYDAAHAG